MAKTDTIIRVTEDVHKDLSDLMYSVGNLIKERLEVKKKTISFTHVIRFLIEDYKSKRGLSHEPPKNE